MRHSASRPMPVPSRRLAIRWSLALCLGLACALTVAQPAAQAQAQSPSGVIHFVPQSEVTIFDPVTNVAAVTQQHAYLIYDNLFGQDANGEPKPQMVDSYSLDSSGTVYTMTLRPGLKFHDGSPVRAVDAVASIKRWAQRDTVGLKLVSMGLKLGIVDDRTFTVATDVPTPLVLQGFAKPTSSALFVMREKDAQTAPATPVTANIGSGPFRFVASEYRPGAKLVYERNPDYVPRAEPPSNFAGGKVVHVNRVEFDIIPDSSTAMNALIKGDIDIYEAPPLDLLPLLAKRTDIRTRALNKGGIMGVIRPNHLRGVFHNEKARQALLAMVDQSDYLQLLGGDDQKNWVPCWSFLGCSAPNTPQGPLVGVKHPDLEKARKLLQESGYKGEPVVVMEPNDNETIRPITQLTVETMRKVGFNVQVDDIDWATMLSQRARQAPSDQGGWDIFLTWSYSFELSNPVVNFFLSSPCGGKGWFGWPCDPEMEKLRDAWATEPDKAKRDALGMQIQSRAADTVPFVPLGQYLSPIAYSTRVENLVDAPVTVFWGLSKKP